MGGTVEKLRGGVIPSGYKISVSRDNVRLAWNSFFNIITILVNTKNHFKI